MLPLIFSSLVSLFFASRATPKKQYYIKNIPRGTSINTTINRLFESVIRRNGQLAINVSNLNLWKTSFNIVTERKPVQHRPVPVPEAIPADMKTGLRII